MVNANENLISVAKAAQICGVSTKTVYGWMNRGLEWRKYGGAKRTSVEALDRFSTRPDESAATLAVVRKDLKERLGIDIGKEGKHGRKKEGRSEMSGVR